MLWKIMFPYSSPQLYENADEAAIAITSDENYIENLDVDIDDLLDSNGRIDIYGESYWPSALLKAVDEERYYEIVDEERRYTAENNKDDVADELERMLTDDEEEYPGRISARCLRGTDYEEEEENEFEENKGLTEVLDYVV